MFFSIPICRLWAEVFHVTTSSSGTVKWTQVSEDLVPVNITCIQDSPEVIFHITAYNSQVEKILDVRLLQPGKRIPCRLKYTDFIKYFHKVKKWRHIVNIYLIFRNKNWTSIRVFYLLERHVKKWYLGSEFYIPRWCQTVSRMLRKYENKLEIFQKLSIH